MFDSVLLDFAEAGAADVGRLLTASARAVNADLMSRLADMGHADIRPSHLAAFAGLESGGTQISVLAARAGHSRQAMSAVVREIEKLGYVTTLPDPSDKRAVLVLLTDRGVAFCEDAIRISRTMTDEFEAQLGAEAVEVLRRTLRAITDGPAEPA